MINSSDKTIQLHDGRTLGYAEYGNPKGRQRLLMNYLKLLANMKFPHNRVA